MSNISIFKNENLKKISRMVFLPTGSWKRLVLRYRLNFVL